MSEYIVEAADSGETFDQDFHSPSTNLTELHHEVPQLDVNSFSGQEIFDQPDPLKHAQQYQCPKLDLTPGEHFVQPHYVDGYFRSDGTYVEGYYRDGGGNTNVNHSVSEGGGYTRTNPDGLESNNKNF
ncbi:hypothetical protein [Halobacillus litoralis]|uniref:hypothetical protein n=1 Tax=Halobacillus litoralis TaxID=45668 RepID=UPI001CFE19D3|nr:hypothetical protein [Halobacillus litoralis]